MAVRGPVVNIPGLKAGEDIAANIVVKLDSTESFAVVKATAAGPFLGVSTRASKDGEAVALESLNSSTVVVVEVGTALARGARVGVDAAGKAITRSGTNPSIGHVAKAYAVGDYAQVYTDITS
jgi:hypothetical protein